MTVGNERVCGKCIIVNKNVEHAFSCDGKTRLSILIDPSSHFAKSLNKKIDGDHLVCDKDGIKRLQGQAVVEDSGVFDSPDEFLPSINSFTAARKNFCMRTSAERS